MGGRVRKRITSDKRNRASTFVGDLVLVLVGLWDCREDDAENFEVVDVWRRREVGRRRVLL